MCYASVTLGPFHARTDATTVGVTGGLVGNLLRARLILKRGSLRTALHRLRGSHPCVGYCTELATCENTVFALEPTRRIVPTTRTRITASITAYSAMS